MNSRVLAIDHSYLREFLRRRMNDGSIMRLIGKWLHAGVLDEGVCFHPETVTRWGHLPDRSQCLPALCAGQLVRPGSPTTIAGPFIVGILGVYGTHPDSREFDKGLPVTDFRQAQFAAVEQYNRTVAARYRGNVLAVDSGPMSAIKNCSRSYMRRLTKYAPK